MAIDYELVQGGELDVFRLLWNQLDLDSPNAQKMCDDYAQEATQIADKREELNKKLERLTEAAHHLFRI